MASPPMVGAVPYQAWTARWPWLKFFFPVVPARAELRMRLGSKYRQA